MDGSNLTYIIGDVHGCYLTLKELVKKIPAGAKIIFVGDLIDRGPRSKEVVEFVKNGGYDCCLANHEQMMLKDYPTPQGGWAGESFWEMNGGRETLASYNGNTELLEEHIEWMKSLPLYLEYKDIVDEQGRYLIVSHSTLGDYFEQYLQIKDLTEEDEPETDDPEELHRFYETLGRKENFEESMLWRRGVPKVEGNNFFNVFGHIPVDYFKLNYVMTNCDDSEVVLSKKLGFADIDTGCVYNKKDRNTLTAIEFPSLKIISQENID